MADIKQTKTYKNPTKVQDTPQNESGLDVLVQQMITDSKTSLDNKNYEQAVNCYEIGVSFESKSRILHVYGGSAYFNLKKYNDASRVLKKAKELSDTVQEKEEVFEMLIPSLINLKEYSAVLELSTERIKNIKQGNPENAKIHYTHAFILYKLGNFVESSRYTSLALQENTKSGQAWYLLGNNLLKMNNPKNALVAFGQALTNKCTNLELIYGMAIAYAKLDKKESCFRALQTCIRKDVRYRTIIRETPDFSKFISDVEFAKLTAPTGTTMIRKKQ